MTSTAPNKTILRAMLRYFKRCHELYPHGRFDPDNPPDDPGVCLTTGELAKLAGLDRMTIWRAVRAGQIPAFQGANGQWQIPLSELQLWAEEGEPVQPEAKEQQPVEEAG